MRAKEFGKEKTIRKVSAVSAVSFHFMSFTFSPLLSFSCSHKHVYCTYCTLQRTQTQTNTLYLAPSLLPIPEQDQSLAFSLWTQHHPALFIYFFACLEPFNQKLCERCVKRIFQLPPVTLQVTSPHLPWKKSCLWSLLSVTLRKQCVGSMKAFLCLKLWCLKSTAEAYYEWLCAPQACSRWEIMLYVFQTNGVLMHEVKSELVDQANRVLDCALIWLINVLILSEVHSLDRLEACWRKMKNVSFRLSESSVSI